MRIILLLLCITLLCSIVVGESNTVSITIKDHEGKPAKGNFAFFEWMDEDKSGYRPNSAFGQSDVVFDNHNFEYPVGGATLGLYFIYTDGDIEAFDIVHLASDEKGQVNINFNKELTIDQSNMGKDHRIEIRTKSMACNDMFYNRVSHIQMFNTIFGKFRRFLPNEFDDYLVEVSTINGTWSRKKHYGYVKIEDGDSLVIDGNKPYLNGKLIPKISVNELNVRHCFTFNNISDEGVPDYTDGEVSESNTISVTIKDENGEPLMGRFNVYEWSPKDKRTGYGINFSLSQLETVFDKRDFEYPVIGPFITFNSDYFFDYLGDEKVLWNMVHIHPEDKGPVILNLNKKITIDQSAMHEKYSMTFQTKYEVCNWKFSPIFHNSRGDSIFGKFWIFLPDEFDDYLIKMRYWDRERGGLTEYYYYGYVGLEDGDSIVVKDDKPYLNGELIRELSKEEMDVKHCFTFSGDRYIIDENKVEKEAEDDSEEPEPAELVVDEEPTECEQDHILVNGECIAD